jgi:hypothetical protein
MCPVGTAHLHQGKYIGDCCWGNLTQWND